jgi:hypothetical protein
VLIDTDGGTNGAFANISQTNNRGDYIKNSGVCYDPGSHYFYTYLDDGQPPVRMYRSGDNLVCERMPLVNPTDMPDAGLSLSRRGSPYGSTAVCIQPVTRLGGIVFWVAPNLPYYFIRTV